MKVKIKIIDGGKLPEYKTEGAVCADCYARLSAPFISIPKGKRCLVNLGFAIELPKGYEAVVRPRSGNSKKGIDIAIGTIDFDFKGEIKACVINNTDGDLDIHNGERICQLKIQKAEQFKFCEVDTLSETERGEKGFGSTGSM